MIAQNIRAVMKIEEKWYRERRKDKKRREKRVSLSKA
jgi:hypothetical protein